MAERAKWRAGPNLAALWNQHLARFLLAQDPSRFSQTEASPREENVVVKSLNIAVVQSEPRVRDVEHNAAEAAHLVTQLGQAGVEFCIFPELSLTGYDLGILEDPTVWIRSGDERLAALRSACRNTGMTAVVSAPFLTHDGRRWIAAIAVPADGNDIVQGKRHLHGHETEHFEADTRPLRCLPVKGWQIALAVCYDAAVPAHAIEAAAAGADLYAVPCLYTAAQRRRLDIHMAARAMDHNMHTVAANLAGSGAGWTSCGASGVWLPDGTQGDHLNNDEGILTTRLDKHEA